MVELRVLINGELRAILPGPACCASVVLSRGVSNQLSEEPPMLICSVQETDDLEASVPIRVGDEIVLTIADRAFGVGRARIWQMTKGPVRAVRAASGSGLYKLEVFVDGRRQFIVREPTELAGWRGSAIVGVTRADAGPAPWIALVQHQVRSGEPEWGTKTITLTESNVVRFLLGRL
jgi:hypothetical protein